MIDWGERLTVAETKLVQRVWCEFFPFEPLKESISPMLRHLLVRRLDAAAHRFPAVSKIIKTILAGTSEDIENRPTIPQSQGEEANMGKPVHQAPAAAPQTKNAPPAAVTATKKDLTPEQQIELDKEINSGLGGKKPAKEKTPAGPRGGNAPGGVTWVQWFRNTVGPQKEGETPETYTKRCKDAETQYIELRKGEVAYAGEEGEKKLKRHAYHHRTLALVDSDKQAATAVA